jgi:hypothetical protein
MTSGCIDNPTRTEELENKDNVECVFIILLVVMLLIFYFIGLYAVQERDAARERSSNDKRKAEEANGKLQKLEQEMERERAALEKRLQESAAVILVERSVLATEREELERQKLTHAAAARAIQVVRDPPTAKEWEQLGIAVRSEQFRGCGGSPEVTVQHFLDPKTSGAVVFDWEITTQNPHPPTLNVFRNGELIRTEGTFKGRFGTRLLSRTKRYQFLFKVSDGGREYPNPLLVEITAPPFDAWVEPPTPPPTPKEIAKQTREEWIAEQVALAKKMKQWPATAKARKEAMAKLEAEALKKFGEAE